MVDVDGSCPFSSDSQPKSIGLVRGLAATRRSVCIHQMKRVNSRNDLGHDNSAINFVVVIIIIIIIITQAVQLHEYSKWYGVGEVALYNCIVFHCTAPSVL